MIEPEIREMIKALRAGKTSGEAAQVYCWARCVIPMETIRRRSFATDWQKCSSFFRALQAFDAGADDATIAAEFDRGCGEDREIGTYFRAAQKHERPTAGELIRSLSLDDQVTAAKLVGVRFVADAIAGAR